MPDAPSGRTGIFEDVSAEEARRRLEAVWAIIDRLWVEATPQMKQMLEEIEGAVRPELKQAD